ncbi:site-specific integrase [Clostridiales bacterium]|nr:site-specific integrase [Clostridiales bacterium]
MPGTMRKRGGDSWYLEVTIGTDFRGKPIRYNRTVHGTRKQAERELAKFYSQCENGEISKQSITTVYQMCNTVMDKKIRPASKNNTIKGYESILRQIQSTIGSQKASKLKPIHVQEWVNYLSYEYENPRRRRKSKDAGLSPKSVKNAYSFLNMCYETMIEWGELDKKPTSHIRLPKQSNKEVDALTKDEVVLFLGLLDTLPREKQDFKVAVLLALFCGLRRGEICGIDEETVDFDEMSIPITKTRYIGPDGVFEDTPKSESSIRKVYFPDEVGKEIQSLIIYHKELRLQLGCLWNNSPALIKGTFGSPLYPTLLWDDLNKLLQAHAMRHFGLHCLRHTYTAMLSWLGKDISEISKSLGHSQKSTTLNTYMHLFQDADDAKRKTALELSNQIAEFKRTK